MRNTTIIALVLAAACGGKGAVKKPVVTPPPPPETISKPAPPPPPPMTTEERLAVHDACFADFIAEEPEFFTRCYTETSSDDMIDDGEEPAVGTPAIAASTRPLWLAFELEGQIRMNLANGENALTIALVRGTQDGPFNGMPPTGKTFGVFVAEAQNLDERGRHGVVRSYIDFRGVMAQLGAAPKGSKFRAAYPMSPNPPLQVIATGGEVETANVAMIQAGFDKFNQKDWKGLTALYEANAAIYNQTAPVDTEGSRAIGKYFAEVGKAFSDGQEKIEAIWGAGDFVVAETTYTGTNDGPWPALGIKKATKKAVTVRTAHVFRIVDGKVSQQWIFSNGLAAPLQLGLIAPPAPPAPPAS